MKKNINKKSSVTFIFAIIISTIIGFFIIFNFLIQNQDIISSSTQDLACKLLTSGKDFSKLGLGVYLYEFRNKCVVDKINVNNIDKDSTIKPVAEEMRKCWYKYGEGKSDFLSNWDTLGEYCFECAQINYKNENNKVYKYNEFVDWIKNNKFKSKDGSKIYYSDYFSVLEVKNLNRDSASYSDVFNKIKNSKFITSQGEDYSKDFEKVYTDMYTSSFDILNSYKVKKLDPKEKNFVVFKYIRVKKDLTDKFFEMIDTSTNLIEAGLGGYTIFHLFKTIGIVKSSPSKIKNLATNTRNTISNAKKLKVGDFVWYKSGKKLVKHKIKAIGSTGKITLQSLTGSKQVFQLGTEKSKTLIKSFGKLNGNKLTKAVVKSTLKFIKKNPYIGIFLAVVGTLATKTDKNYIQYVELLNQEQYYRSCGTQRFPNN